MRKIITTTWVTLDGYIAGPNGEMEWIGEIYDEAMGAYESERRLPKEDACPRFAEKIPPRKAAPA